MEPWKFMNLPDFITVARTIHWGLNKNFVWDMEGKKKRERCWNEPIVNRDCQDRYTSPDSFCKIKNRSQSDGDPFDSSQYAAWSQLFSSHFKSKEDEFARASPVLVTPTAAIRITRPFATVTGVARVLPGPRSAWIAVLIIFCSLTIKEQRMSSLSFNAQ